MEKIRYSGENRFRSILVCLSVCEKGSNLYGLDSKDGSIVWKSFIEFFEGNKLEILSSSEQPSFIVSGRIGRKSHLLVFEAATGRKLEERSLEKRMEGFSKLPIKITSHKSLFLSVFHSSEEEKRVRILPEEKQTLKVVSQNFERIFFYELHSDSIKGYKLFSPTNATLVWDFNLANKKLESISNTQLSQKVNSIAEVKVDGSLLAKYVNFNLLTFTTSSPSSQTLTFYVLDASNGRVLFSQIHQHASGPVKMDHFENMIVYFYKNVKTHKNQVSTVQIFDEASLLPQLWKNFWKNAFGLSSKANGERKEEKQNPVTIVSQSFEFPLELSDITFTQTKTGLTPKHLLIATSSGSIVSLHHSLFDARRPLTEQKPSPISPDNLIPYSKSIQVPPQAIITHSNTVCASLFAQFQTSNFYTFFPKKQDRAN